MKKYEKYPESTQVDSRDFKSFAESSAGLNSHRTLERNKIIMSTDKLETY